MTLVCSIYWCFNSLLRLPLRSIMFSCTFLKPQTCTCFSKKAGKNATWHIKLHVAFLKLDSSGRLWYAELRFTPYSGSGWLGYSGVARWGGGVGSKGQLQLRTCLSHFPASRRCTYCASLTQLWLLLLYCLSRITIWCYMLMKGRLTCWLAASSAGT